MPWTCSCQIEHSDDVDTCDDCGQNKAAWTLHVDQTRTLQISSGRAKLECRVGFGDAPLGEDERSNVGFESAPTDVCPAIPKAELLRLVEAQQLPALAQRLVVRVTPRKLARTLAISVEPSQDDPIEHDFDDAAEAAELSEDGWFEVQLVAVFGPEDVSDLALPHGLLVLDVTEDSEEGFAPTLEVASVRKVCELEIEPVRQPGLQLLEVEDICFATSREVLLPGGWSASDELTGLTVCAAALEHARKHPELRLLVAGHADARGSVSSNLVLSSDRAQNVYLYLSGQRTAWAEHCLKHAEVQDLQSVLAWIAWQHEWDCDPGKIDGKWGNATSTARARFRERYNEDHGGALEDGKTRAADWEAFYDLYDLSLAEKLVTDGARVNELRGQLQFTEPAYLGCSEHWPTQRPGAPEDHSADRRVDVIFLPEEDVPDLAAEPPGQPIYGEGTFNRDYLTVDEAFAEPEPPYGNAPFEDPDCEYRPTHHDENPDWTGNEDEPEVYLARSVTHQVPLVGQPDGVACWATGAAMVAAWRDEVEAVESEELAKKEGPWAPYASGVDAEQVALQHWKLSERAGEPYSAETIAELLEAHGPLWVATKANGEPHARVLTGISGDGSGDATVVYLNDPWPAGNGARQELPFKTFAAHFGGLASGCRERLDAPLYVAHV